MKIYLFKTETIVKEKARHSGLGVEYWAGVSSSAVPQGKEITAHTVFLMRLEKQKSQNFPLDHQFDD